MIYLRLIKILLVKEKVHYKRMGKLFMELEDIGGKLIAYPIIFTLVTFFHYCFAFMHASFETFLYFYDKERFVVNVSNMERRINVQII